MERLPYNVHEQCVLIRPVHEMLNTSYSLQFTYKVNHTTSIEKVSICCFQKYFRVMKLIK